MIQTMQERLLTLEMDKQRLLTLYTDNDRRVQDKQQEIDAQKKRLAEAQEQQWIPDSEVTQLNDRRRDLEEKVLASRLSALKTKVRHEGAKAIAVEMRERVQELGLADVQKQALLREIQASSEAYLLYRKKAEEARITAAMDENKITNVAIGELASRGAPIGPPKNLSLLFAVMVGLVSGVGGAFLREFFDGSIKTEHEIRSSVDLPVLGSIPEEKSRQEERQRTQRQERQARSRRLAPTTGRAVTTARPGQEATTAMSRVFQALERTEGLRRRKTSAILDAPQQDNRSRHPSPSDTGEFERLAGAILQARSAAPFTTMMIASPHHGEGTSTVAVGLARILAGRLRVLLVDANFRSPGLTDLLLEAEPRAGLAEALAGAADVETIIAETNVPGLRLVAAGAVDSESPRLLQTSRLAPLMSRLAETADLVILDAPPVMPYADALTLASRVERVVLVTQAEHTQRGHLERAKEELDKSGTAILGVVLNRTASHAPSWLQRRLNL